MMNEAGVRMFCRKMHGPKIDGPNACFVGRRMKTRMAASSLIALLVLAAPFLDAHAYAPTSDAAFAGELSAISASALKAATKQKAQAVEAAAARGRPDSTVTPGNLCTLADPNFKEYRYAEHIAYCQRHVTKAMKREVAAHYGVPESEWSNYEFDHLIPLAIGGNSSTDNLWPEPDSDNEGEGSKDKLEQKLYLKMRDGKITQAEAVRQIYAWFDAYMAKRAKKSILSP